MESHIRKTGVFKYSVATVFTLILLKTVASIRTSSLGLLGSAVDSFLDLFSSLLNWFSLAQAEKPADAEHPYGHGKIESLAGLFQSLVLSCTAFYLMVEAYRRYQTPTLEVQALEAIAVMVISLLATAFLVWKINKTAQQTDSLILKAEALHFQSDFLSGIGIIASLVMLRWTGWLEFDFFAGVAIAIYILIQSAKLFWTSVNELIDRALPLEESQAIKKIILEFDPRILNIHEFRTRKMGPIRFVDCHIEIRGIVYFEEAHKLTEDIIKAIRKQFTDMDITIHYDPEGAE